MMILKVAVDKLVTFMRLDKLVTFKPSSRTSFVGSFWKLLSQAAAAQWNTCPSALDYWTSRRKSAVAPWQWRRCELLI